MEHVLDKFRGNLIGTYKATGFGNVHIYPWLVLYENKHIKHTQRIRYAVHMWSTLW